MISYGGICVCGSRMGVLGQIKEEKSQSSVVMKILEQRVSLYMLYLLSSHLIYMQNKYIPAHSVIVWLAYLTYP